MNLSPQPLAYIRLIQRSYGTRSEDEVFWNFCTTPPDHCANDKQACR
jgi:hypothetical protein